MQLMENPRTPQLDHKAHIYIGFTPLLGAAISVDIVEWCITILGGPFGAFLTQVKEKLATGYNGANVGASATLELILSVSANMNAELHWQKELGQEWTVNGKQPGQLGQTTSEVSNNLAITVEGNISGKLHVFAVVVRAGAEFKADSSVSIKLEVGVEDNKPYLAPQCLFNGLTVYWAVYFQANKIKQSKKASTQWESESNTNINNEDQGLKFNHSQVILDPHSWPDDDSAKIFLHHDGAKL